MFCFTDKQINQKGRQVLQEREEDSTGGKRPCGGAEGGGQQPQDAPSVLAGGAGAQDEGVRGMKGFTGDKEVRGEMHGPAGSPPWPPACPGQQLPGNLSRRVVATRGSRDCAATWGKTPFQVENSK